MAVRNQVSAVSQNEEKDISRRARKKIFHHREHGDHGEKQLTTDCTDFTDHSKMFFEDVQHMSRCVAQSRDAQDRWMVQAESTEKRRTFVVRSSLFVIRQMVRKIQR